MGKAQSKQILKLPRSDGYKGELVKISEPLYRVLSIEEEKLSLIAETLFETGDITQDEFIEVQAASSMHERSEKLINTFIKNPKRTTESYERLTQVLNRYDTKNTWVLLNYAGLNADIPHTTVIKDQYEQLLDGIKTCLDDVSTADLIERLRQSGAIDERERNEIIDEGSSGQKAHKLLSILSRPYKTVNHFELLLAAQGFPVGIATTIRQKLSCLDCKLLSRCIKFVRLKLRDFIETDYGLLSHLEGSNVLTQEERRQVKDKQTLYDRVDQLLEFMCEKCEDRCKRFTEVLEETGQKHVANFIRYRGRDVGDEVGDEYPLSDEVIDSLRFRRPIFEEYVECNYEMITKLHALGCINQRQKEALQDLTRSSLRNALLFDMLLRSSVGAYNNFLKCLDKTCQSHLIPMVTDDGAIMKVIATLENTPQSELLIVSKFNRLLLGRSDKHKVSNQLNVLMEKVSLSCRQRMAQEVESRMTASFRLGKDINLVCLRVGKSIHSYFCCQSSDALITLFMNKECLKTILECIFTHLYSGDEKISVLDVHWDPADYQECMIYLGELSPFKRLPLELLELLLIRSTIAMFVDFKATYVDADNMSLINMWSVCKKWELVITNRQWNRNQLRHNFEDKRPYAKKLTCETVVAVSKCNDNWATGVAVCGDRLYMVKARSSTVEVFSAIAPYEYQNGIDIPGNANDMVSYDERGQLYVCDPHKRRVWTLIPGESTEIREFARVAAWRLFVDKVNKQLLMTSPMALNFYGLDDGKLRQTIKLPAFMDAIHSVRTPDGRVLVCHTTQTGDAFHQVSEVNEKGVVVRAFGGTKGDDIDKLSSPRCMDVDGEGRVLVADMDNHRIVVLNSKLQHERTWLNESDEGSGLALNCPVTVRYLARDGRLLVGNKHGSVSAYNLRKVRRETSAVVQRK